MSEQKQYLMGRATRSGKRITFAETDDLATSYFQGEGGNRDVNVIYARRIVASMNACKGAGEYALAAIESTGGLGQFIKDVEDLTQQRDDLLAALKVASVYLPLGSDQHQAAKAVIAKVESK